MLRLRLALLVMISFSCLHAQDVFFSQYNSAPLLLNPAFAGSTGHARAGLSLRDQWPNVSWNFITTNVSYDQHFAKLHGGLGLNLQNSMAMQGAMNTNKADLSYAFHLPLFQNRFVVRPAVSIGLTHVAIDYDKLNFGDITDPRRGFVFQAVPAGKTTRTNLDFGMGFIAYTKRMLFGFSSVHLTPNLDFLGDRPIPQRSLLHFSYVIGHVPGDFENKISVIPQATYVVQASTNQLTGGISVLVNHYTIGAAYRSNDALIFMAGFQNRLFRAAYNYDYTISAASNRITGGAHEVSVQFFLFRKRKPEGFLAPANIVF